MGQVPSVFSLAQGFPMKYFSTVCFFLVSVLMTVTSFAQSDVGSSNPFNLAKQAFSNAATDALSQISPIQRISLINQIEQELRRSAADLTEEDYLSEMTQLAELYWQNRAYDRATDTYQEVAKIRPESLYAANAYMMSGAIAYGNRMTPEKALPDLRKSVAILKRLNDGQALFRRDEVTARAVSMLGDVYLVTDRKSEALKEYEYLLASQNVLAAADESVIINANIESARILSAEGRYDEAMVYYKTLEPLVRDSNLPAKIRIGLSLESWDAHSQSGMTKNELIFYLEELWMSERESEEFPVLYLGNNLSLLYFFSEDQEQKSKFPSMAQELIEKADKIKDAQKDSLSRDNLKTIRSIVHQTKLMAAERNLAKSEQREFQKWVNERVEEEEKNPNKVFTPFVPVRFPKQVVMRLLEFHEKHVGSRTSPKSNRRAPAEAVSVLDGKRP